MRSSALQWEVAVSFPKDGHGSWGKTGMNIKHCASFLDRTGGRDSRKRTRGEGSREARKETSFFKLIPSPKCSSQLPLQHEEASGTISMAVREHLPGHIQKFAPFLSHTSHSCAHNKKWGLCGLQRGLVWRLMSRRESNKVWQHQGWESYPEATYLVICNDVSVQQLAKAQSQQSIVYSF